MFHLVKSRYRSILLFILEFMGIFEFRFAFIGMLPVELTRLAVFAFIGIGDEVAIGTGDAEFAFVT